MTAMIRQYRFSIIWLACGVKTIHLFGIDVKRNTLLEARRANLNSRNAERE